MFPKFEVEASGEVPDQILLTGKQFPEGVYLVGRKLHLNESVDH